MGKSISPQPGEVSMAFSSSPKEPPGFWKVRGCNILFHNNYAKKGSWLPAGLAAATTSAAATSTTLVTRRAVTHARAANPVSKPVILSCPAPFARARLRARLVAMAPSTASEVILKPAAARLEAANLKITLREGLSRFSLRMFFACSDSVGINAIGEVWGIHDTEVATKWLGLGLGEFGSGGETEKAKGSNEVDDGCGLHDVSSKLRKNRKESCWFSHSLRDVLVRLWWVC